MKSKQNAAQPRRTANHGRKPYHSPKLVFYGDVRQLTDGSTGGMALDASPTYANPTT
jgi:hypothetical protein